MTDPSALETAARELLARHDDCPYIDLVGDAENLRAALDTEPDEPTIDPDACGELRHGYCARPAGHPGQHSQDGPYPDPALDAEPVELDSPDFVHPETTELAARGYKRINRDTEPVGR